MLGRDPKDIAQKILALADVRLDGTRPWDITVYNEDFYPRVLRLGSLGLGESYMDRGWDCRALDEFFCRILSAGLERDGAHDWRFAWRYLLASAFNRQSRTRARQVADQRPSGRVRTRSGKFSSHANKPPDAELP